MADERVLEALDLVSTDVGAVSARIGEIQPSPTEVGPGYADTYNKSRPGARWLAAADAESLPRIDQHRQLFQSVALTSDDEQRRTLIEGYRDAGHDRWIVHAIGQCPRCMHARFQCRGPRRAVSDRS